MSPGDDSASRTRYQFAISLRVRHPSMAPKDITEALGLEPKRCWEAGEPRRSPTGRLLLGSNRETYWTARLVQGCAPASLNNAVFGVLKDLVLVRSFLHRIRAEGGTAELFTGWFFDSQGGDTLTHDCLALAGDLKLDLSLDVYPAELQDNEACNVEFGSPDAEI